MQRRRGRRKSRRSGNAEGVMITRMAQKGTEHVVSGSLNSETLEKSGWHWSQEHQQNHRQTSAMVDL